MPGMAPPVPHNGDFLVDGAVLNNLPADIQQSLTFGRTIAVDANPAVDLRAECDYGPTLSAGRLLWSWLNPFIPTIKAPHIYAIIDRVALLNSVRQAAALDQDEKILYLHPQTDKFGLLDFERIHEIADAGYQYALPRLEAWERP
jgi:predicted acylesterase/phospholipase RssA